MDNTENQESIHKIEEILQQAPNGVTGEQVKDLYDKHNGNTVDILAELWDIKPVNSTQQTLQNMDVDELRIKNKLSEVRDICNCLDEEMSKYLEQIRNKHLQNKQTENSQETQ